MDNTVASWTQAQLERFFRTLRIGTSQLPHSLTLQDLELTGSLHLSDQAVKQLKKQLGL